MSKLQAEIKPASAPDASTPGDWPTVDEILARYVQALGGAEAIEKISSREQAGTTTVDGKSVAVESFDQNSAQWALVRHLPRGDSAYIFDGHEGWSSIPGRPPHALQGAELDAAAMDADLQLPLHLRQRFDELRVEDREAFGGRQTYRVEGRRQAQPPVQFYFDEQSGLLVRLVRFADSAFGMVPTQIDYDDYRDAGGVQAPFRWTIARPDERSVIQWQRIEENVAIDSARFARPAEAAGDAIGSK